MVTVRALVAAIVLAGGLVAPDTSLAQVVIPAPANVAISLSRIPATIQVRWALGPSGPWESTSGSIRTVGPGPQTLASLPPILNQPSNFTVRETIVLPVSEIRALAESGVRRLVVVRSWDDDSGDSTVVAVPLVLTSSLGASFRVSRIELRFPDGAPLRIVSQFSRQEAFADVSYAGGGQFEAVWEVADPTTTSGAPVFRPLRRVRRLLTGGQRTSVRSPPLPTTLTGLHLVRLRLDGTDASFVEPVLRYYVAEEDVPVDPVVVPLESPAHEALLAQETVFRWMPVQGAKAYRLEIHAAPALPPGPHFRLDPDHPTYADPRSPAARRSAYEGATLPGDDPPLPTPGRREPVAGVLVGGDRTEARLGAARRKLEAGGTYLWVVRALGEGGVPIGLSPTRVIRVPE